MEGINVVGRFVQVELDGEGDQGKRQRPPAVDERDREDREDKNNAQSTAVLNTIVPSAPFRSRSDALA